MWVCCHTTLECKQTLLITSQICTFPFHLFFSSLSYVCFSPPFKFRSLKIVREAIFKKILIFITVMLYFWLNRNIFYYKIQQNIFTFSDRKFILNIERKQIKNFNVSFPERKQMSWNRGNNILTMYIFSQSDYFKRKPVIQMYDFQVIHTYFILITCV